MMGSQESTARPTKVIIPDSLAAQLHRKAGAEKFGMSPEAFAGILQQVAAKYVPATASAAEILEFVSHLRVEELALARGCASGNDAAWEVFLTRYREKLYNAAHSLVPGDANARELADSLYADLWGTRTTDGRRISKLNSFTGRGSLEGWLRAVLAQEYVNRFRRQQRSVSLEEQTEAGVQFEAEAPDPSQAIDPRLCEATDEALASLAPEDKFILASYYLDGRTLAEIARLMGVHESTISRKLEKITTWTREAIRARLMKRGMSRKEAEQSMEVEVTELSLEVRRRLMQENGPQTVP
jgi:RNA polymerase sigma-70 factor (ECF subfamily)